MNGIARKMSPSNSTLDNDGSEELGGMTTYLGTDIVSPQQYNGNDGEGRLARGGGEESAGRPHSRLLLEDDDRSSNNVGGGIRKQQGSSSAYLRGGEDELEEVREEQNHLTSSRKVTVV